MPIFDDALAELTDSHRERVEQCLVIWAANAEWGQLVANIRAECALRLEGDLAGEQRRTTLPPPRERDDELMDNPPVGDHHRGRLGGHQKGRRMRLIFGVVLVALIAGGVAVMVWYVRNKPPEHSSQFELPAGSDLEGRPRVMTWTGGKARLGLDRKPPGVLEIALPDRTLRLAEGSDQAQMKIDVEDGKTVALKVIFGDVVEDLAPGARPLL